MPEVRTTLPGRDYHAPEVFELERERIFFRTWMYAGRADEAPEPGDFVTVDVAGESVIVVRGKDGELRAFYNVCRHRGSRLCDAETHGPHEGRDQVPVPRVERTRSTAALIGTPIVGKDEIDRATLCALAGARSTCGKGSSSCTSSDPVAARASRSAAVRQAAAVRALQHRRAADRPRDRQRGRGELEDPDRELQRVPALPDRASRAGRSSRPHSARGSVFEAQSRRRRRRDRGRRRRLHAHRARSTLPLHARPRRARRDARCTACTVYPNMFLDLTGTGRDRDAHAAAAQPGHTTVVTTTCSGPRSIADPGFDPSEVVEFSRARRPPGLRGLRARAARRAARGRSPTAC